MLALVAAATGAAEDDPVADEVAESVAGRESADAGPYELTADRVEYEAEDELFVAEGNVLIVRGDRSLRADWVAFSNETRRGVASGGVVLVDGDDVLLAEFAAFEVDTLEGVLFDSIYDAPETRFHVRAREIARTGDDTYEVEDGTFTTCRCPDDPDTDRPPWRITAESTDIEVGGYGTARNTSVEVLGVPVVWFPWMIYPVKTERQSGVLFPEIGLSGRNGVSLGLPVFWAARHDLNVVVTPRWLSERGFKPDLEMEYVWGTRSWSELYVSWIYDSKIDPDTPSTPFDRNRWGVDWKHDHELPWGWGLRADALVVSDNQYVIDFDDFPGVRVNRYLESTAFVFRDFAPAPALGGWSPLGASGAFAAVQWADDLQNPDNQDRDGFLLQRMPQVHWAALRTKPERWLGLVPSFEADYTHFWGIRDAEDELRGALVSADGSFLDVGPDALPDAEEGVGLVPPGFPDPNQDNAPGGPEGDGVFQEGEPLAQRGHRVMLYPRLARPFGIGPWVDVFPEVGWQQMLYWTDRDSDARGLATAALEARTQLERDLSLPALPRVRHLLEPRLGWAWVSNTQQVGNPRFVPETALPQRRLRQLDLWNVVRDTSDRIEPFHGVTFGFTNRFYVEDDASPLPSLRLELDLLGAWRFDEDRFGLVVLQGRSFPESGLSSRFHVAVDPEKGELSEAYVSAGFELPFDVRMSAGYRYLRDIPSFFEDFATNAERFDENFENLDQVNQVGLGLRVPIGMRWAVTYDVAYSFDSSLLLANRGGIEYFSRCRCWAARVELSEDRQRGVDFRFQIELVGLGRTTPSFGTWEPGRRQSLLDARDGL